MSNYTAAFCSTCGVYVLVNAEGGCVFGHPRSSLRGIYSAQIDWRTGRPKPPSAEQRARPPRPTPPVAPIALPFDAASPVTLPMSDSMPPSVTAPLAPVLNVFGPRIISQSMVAADDRGVVARLFGPSRGRHSAGVLAFGPPRGRHSPKSTGTSGRV